MFSWPAVSILTPLKHTALPVSFCSLASTCLLTCSPFDGGFLFGVLLVTSMQSAGYYHEDSESISKVQLVDRQYRLEEEAMETPLGSRDFYLVV